MKRTLAFIVLCLPLEARGPRCPIALQQTPECSSCTLDEWARKVSSLKERPVEFSSLPDKKKYQENILTFTEYMTTLNKTAAVIARECSIDNQWLNKKSLYSLAPDIFTLNRPSVVPAVMSRIFLLSRMRDVSHSKEIHKYASLAICMALLIHSFEILKNLKNSDILITNSRLPGRTFILSS